MSPLLSEREHYSSLSRIIMFIAGLLIVSYMFLYSFEYESFPWSISFIGYNVTSWIVIVIMVLITFGGSWLMQASILGKKK